MNVVLRQLDKFRSILWYRQITLSQLQKFNLFPASNVFRKIPPQKLSLEHSPGNSYTISIQFSSGSHPPVISLFEQHMSTIPHFQVLSTIDDSENPLDLLMPFLSTFRIMCALEQWRIVPLKTVQLPVSTNTSSICIPSQYTSDHAQSLSNCIIVSSSPSGHYSSKYKQYSLE